MNLINRMHLFDEIQTNVVLVGCHLKKGLLMLFSNKFISTGLNLVVIKRLKTFNHYLIRSIPIIPVVGNLFLWSQK